MKVIIFIICFIQTIIAALLPPLDNVDILSEKECWTNKNNNTITRKFAALVIFSPELNNDCLIRISNPWSSDAQNGFGISLPHSIDCSTMITAECLSTSTALSQVTPSPIQYTCHTSTKAIEMPCNLIGLTFKRNPTIEKQSKKSTNIQVVALAKEPCKDRDLLFQCPRDYPHSCLDRKLQCNGRSECPSGDDERGCHSRTPAGIPIIVIILLVLAFLFLICVLSTVLICCCCRAACNAIIQRIRPNKKNKSAKNGELAIATGEDAGLMKGLTTPSVIEALPQQHTEPTPLIIDSTKPVYPRLE